METRTGEEMAEQGLLEEIDRLAEKMDLAVSVIAELRKERTALRVERDVLRKDRERILDAAKATSTEEVLQKLGRVRELESRLQALEQERQEVARRLSALIEKVDSLEEGTVD